MANARQVGGTFPDVLPAPLVSLVPVKPQLRKGSLSWAGNPLLPPSFPQSQPSLGGEGKGIFSTHPPVVLRIELKRGIDVRRRAGFALKGRVCVFPTSQSLQNFSCEEGLVKIPLVGGGSL